MTAAIVTRGLRKVFTVHRKPEGGWARVRALLRPEVAEHEAVRGLDLEVARGEALAFIGPNGAGKSTTIKMLTGILHPTAGEAQVLGRTPWKDRKALAYRIGSVFGQKSQLWLHLPPVDTFNLLARIYELDRAAYLKRRGELVELFELGKLLEVPARKLSLGQRMRCELAACLLHRPDIIFLDEPTIGLDPVARAAIREFIARANREDGVTIFLTSHDTGDIEHVCRRVVIIHDGALILDDSLANLRRDFMKTRQIELELAAAPAATLDLPGVRVVEARGLRLRLAADTSITPIEAVVAAILRTYPVADIAIQHPPIEQVVIAVYQAAGRAAS